MFTHPAAGRPQVCFMTQRKARRRSAVNRRAFIILRTSQLEGSKSGCSYGCASIVPPGNNPLLARCYRRRSLCGRGWSELLRRPYRRGPGIPWSLGRRFGQWWNTGACRAPVRMVAMDWLEPKGPNAFTAEMIVSASTVTEGSAPPCPCACSRRVRRPQGRRPGRHG